MRRSFSGAASLSAALLTPTSAFAEVCDKIADRWNSADGPITIPQEAMITITSPLTIALLAGAILCIVVRRPSVGYVVAILSVAMATASFVWGGMGEMGAFAMKEGCKTGFPTQGWVIAAVGLIGLIAGWYAGKTRTFQ